MATDAARADVEADQRTERPGVAKQYMLTCSDGQNGDQHGPTVVDLFATGIATRDKKADDGVDRADDDAGTNDQPE